jgi:zinc D-Ala-D-Ala dipeptidase
MVAAIGSVVCATASMPCAPKLSVGFGADDRAALPDQPLGQAPGGGKEGRRIAAESAKPVAQPAIDGSHGEAAVRVVDFGEQSRCRGNAGQRHIERHCQAARRGEPDPHAGEAARPHRDGEQADIATFHAGRLQDRCDRRHQPRRLIAPRLDGRGKASATLDHGHAHAGDRAVEGQGEAHAGRAGRMLARRRKAGHCSIMTPDLIAIVPPDFDVDIALAYATPANLTGKPIYRNAECWLNREAADMLKATIALAEPLGLRLRIFDALRPVEAQWVMWNVNPDPEFLADPRRGSPHSRGAAVDVTLLDAEGRELDMGTSFDAFTPLSHHGRTDIAVAAQHNRFVLMGLMTAAGWDFYRNEWWHYQLFDARRHPLVSNADLPRPMM